MKYTKELLEAIAKESISVSEVLKKLGLKFAGGTHAHLTKKLKKFNIDTSHFLGKGANCGKGHKGGHQKLEWNEVLIKRNDDIRQPSFRLRRALIESGREYICEECGQKPIWNNKELRLQVDHKNSNWLDDRPENLQFICPNCHTQTPGFCGSKGLSHLTMAQRKGIKRTTSKNKTNCIDCNKKILNGCKRCKSCAGKQQANKIEWPSISELISKINTSSYVAVAKELGVSDTAIRKRIKNHGPVVERDTRKF